jgi:hypothetical protein
MRRPWMFGAALVVAAAAAATFGASCGSTPAPTPVRTFLRPQKVDFVCLHVNDANGNPIPPTTAQAAQCPPVPPNVNGVPFEFHYFALVTQTTRGELGVVDLTGGVVVDEDRSTPGVNFIPVGADPTDVAVTPDGSHTYVSSADPNLLAIYGIDNRTILGDSQALSPRLPPLNSFNQIAGCRLSQPPDAIAVLSAPSAAGDAGAEAGAVASSPYLLAVLLRPEGPGVPAQVAVIQPPTQLGGLGPCTVLGMTGALSSSLAGAGLAPGPVWPDGVSFPHDAGDLSATEPSPVPAPVAPEMGPPDASDARAPEGEVSEAGTSDAQAGDGALADALTVDAEPADAVAAEAMALGSSSSSGAAPAQSAAALDVGPLSAPQPTSMVLRDGTPPVLYVADGQIPVIHVIDLSDPGQPKEVSSFLATSQTQPTRRVSIGGLALSPATRDFRRYLYAIDAYQGTLMVFDATDAVPAPFTPPLQRPHAELNPFAPRDRIAFQAPVAAVTFAYNDWPVPPQVDAAVPAPTGLLCNPSPNARVDDGGIGGPAATGAFYCADQATLIFPQGTGVQGFPSRLRGLFGFAMLSDGNIAVVDLDDWDAPCRRPDPMTDNTLTGALDFPEPPPTSSSDLDPYHVPTAYPANLLPSAVQSAVTQEDFFPVSAPNRLRSQYLLRNDPTSGEHMPYVLVTPSLINGTGAPLAPEPTEPVILPTSLTPGFVDPTTYTSPVDPHDNYYGTPAALPDAAVPPSDGGDASAVASLEPGSPVTVPGVRVSFDDPTAHVDQDWWVTYEGALPSVSPLVADIVTTSGYQDLTFAIGAGNGAGPDAGPPDAGVRVAGGFCEMGVEDWDIGQARANQVLKEMAQQRGLPSLSALEATLPQWTSDYIEITDDILPSTDCYWQEGLAGEGGLSGGCLTGLQSVTGNADAGSPVNTCWEGLVVDNTRLDTGPNAATNRYNACEETFGPQAQANSYLYRDFPILEAHDGYLRVGRFKWDPNPGSSSSCLGAVPERTTNRSVFNGPDPNNTDYFKLAQCCFHHQAGFEIRTGGEWAVVGQNGLGFLHHVMTDPTSGRCVLSADPLDALLNGRAFDIPYGPPGASGQCEPPTAQIERSSPLAFRNPMFSFVMWQGCNPLDAIDAGGSPDCESTGDHTSTQRDRSWRFSMRGGFSPLTLSIGAANVVPVVPQSMRPVPVFQQLAIVDGAQQGLVLFDLHSLQMIPHGPYY